MPLRQVLWYQYFLSIHLLFVPGMIAGQVSGPVDLTADKVIEQQISGGESHHYRISVESGQLLGVTAEQHGVDVVLTLNGPDGKTLVRMDSPNGTEGKEPMRWVAAVTGRYEIVVSALEKNVPQGKYTMRAELRAPTENDRRWIAAQSDYVEGMTLSQENKQDKFGPAIAKLKRAQEQWRDLGDNERLTQSLQEEEYCQVRLTRFLADESRYPEAEVSAASALELTKQLAALGAKPSSCSDSSSVSWLAYVYHAEKKNDQAEATYKTAISECPNNSATMGMFSNLAQIYSDENRLTESETMYRRALDASNVAHGVNSTDSADMMSYLGYVLVRESRPTEAEPLLKQALDIYRKEKGLEDVGIVPLLVGLARIELGQDHYADAEKLSRNALEILEKIGGHDDLLAISLSQLADDLDNQGKVAEGLSFRTRDLEILRKIPNSPPEMIAFQSFEEGNEYVLLGKFDEAHSAFENARVIYEKTGPEKLEMARVLQQTALIAEYHNDFVTAEQTARRAIKIFEREQPQGDSMKATLMVLSAALKGQGKFAEADATATRAQQLGSLSEESIKAASLAAKSGPFAQLNMGAAYEHGSGVPQDYKKAEELYRTAAEAGLGDAQLALAELYDFGHGVKQDYNEAFKWYRKAAEQGVVRAQANLGWLYMTGNGVSRDDAEAKRWLQKAAERGDTSAENNFAHLLEGTGDVAEALKWYRKAADEGSSASQGKLAHMYMMGTGVPKDCEQSMRWLRKAVAQSDADAENIMGMAYSQGCGVGQNDTEAASWYRKAAEHGSAWGQNNLGVMYHSGRGVPLDNAEAFKWHLKAAQQGLSSAEARVGAMLAVGQGTQQNFAEAAKWCRAASDVGDLMGAACLGNLYINGLGGLQRDPSQALRLFLLAAEGDNDKSQNNVSSAVPCMLGLMYQIGEGTPKDMPSAVRWYRVAAERGHPDAQNALGYRYLHGEGVPLTTEEALKWFLKAAEQGNWEAENNLATMYDEGNGVTRDSQKALAYFRRSAEKGHANSMYSLGTKYLTGDGVPRDLVEAYKWFSLAVDYAGAIPDLLSSSRENIAEISKRIDLAQTSQADVRKREWLRLYDPPREITMCAEPKFEFTALATNAVSLTPDAPKLQPTAAPAKQESSAAGSPQPQASPLKPQSTDVSTQSRSATAPRSQPTAKETSEALAIMSQSPWAIPVKLKCGNPLGGCSTLPPTSAPMAQPRFPDAAPISPQLPTNPADLGIRPVSGMGVVCGAGSGGSGCDRSTDANLRAAGMNPVSPQEVSDRLHLPHETARLPVPELGNVIVLWESAAPVRVARMQLGFSDSPKYQKADGYVITIIGYPMRAAIGTNVAMTNPQVQQAILQGVTLGTRGKPPIAASDVELTDDDNSMTVRYFFPKTVDFQLGDKEVTLTMQVLFGDMVEAHFNLKRMVYQGKLAVADRPKMP